MYPDKLSGLPPESLYSWDFTERLIVNSAAAGGLPLGTARLRPAFCSSVGLTAVASRWLPRSFLCSFQRAGAGRLEILVPPQLAPQLALIRSGDCDPSVRLDWERAADFFALAN
jgi:hypothetical protein